MSPSLDSTTTNQALSVILKAGLLAGTCDILGAFIHAYFASHTDPMRVLRYVASGVFGAPALTGGTATALWGLLFHFLIATIWASIFYFAYPFIRKISTNWVLNGLAYGVLVWALMNFVVVPLSNTAPRTIHFTWNTFISLTIIMLCIGLPISWMVQRNS